MRLQPFGAVTGRVLDAAGKPQAGITVSLLFEEKQERTLPEEHIFSNSSLRQVLFNDVRALTDKDGRFRIDGLVAGLKYDLGIWRGDQFIGRVLKDVSGQSGATVDVGEIKIKAPSNPRSG